MRRVFAHQYSVVWGIGRFLGGLVEDPKHLLLDSFFLEDQSVFVPDEVWLLGIDTVSLHAALEQVNDVGVVGVLGERQASAVVHVLLELLGLVSAEFLDGDLLLLLLDVGVLLLLGSSRKALPGKLSLEEV